MERYHEFCSFFDVLPNIFDSVKFSKNGNEKRQHNFQHPKWWSTLRIRGPLNFFDHLAENVVGFLKCVDINSKSWGGYPVQSIFKKCVFGVNFWVNIFGDMLFHLFTEKKNHTSIFLTLSVICESGINDITLKALGGKLYFFQSIISHTFNGSNTYELIFLDFS